MARLGIGPDSLNTILSWRSLRSWSIHVQLLALVLAIILPAAAVICYDIVDAARQERERAYGDMRHQARATANELASFIHDTERSLARLGERPLIRIFSPHRCDPIIRETATIFPDVSNLSVRDLSGNSICSFLPNPAPPSAVVGSTWFQTGLRNSGFSSSRAVISPTTGNWVSYMTYPIRDRSGNIGGLIALRIDLAQLQSALIKAAPKHAVIAVFDHDGKYLMRSIDHDKWTGKNIKNPALLKQARFRHESVARFHGGDGIARVYALQPVSGTDWLVGVGISEDLVSRWARERLAQAAALGCAALLAALLLASLISSSIAGPVRRLQRTAQRVANGDLAARAPIDGSAEVATVARQFNHLLDMRNDIETELRQSRQRFALAASTGHIWDWNLRTGECYISPQWKQALGYQDSEVENSADAWQALLHPDDRPAVAEAFRRHLAQCLPYDVKFRSRAKSGHYRWFHATGQAARDENGRATYMAGTLLDITQRECTENELRRYVEQLESLRDMGIAVLAARSPQETATVGLQHLQRLVPFLTGTVRMFDFASDEAVVLAIASAPGWEYTHHPSMSLEQYGLADLDVLKQGRMCVIDDVMAVSERAFTLEALRRQGMQSYVRIPLMVEEKLVGALNLWSDAIAYFTAERLRIARAIADQLAIALQQAILRDRINRLNRIHAVLSSINSLIVRARDRNELYCEACRIAVAAGKFSMVWLGAVDRREMRVKPVASDGNVGDFFDSLPHAADEIKQDRLHPLEQVVIDKKVVLSNDIQNDPRVVTKEKCRERGINSAALLPLIVQGEVVGVLGLYAEEPGFFDSEEMALLIELADNLSFAVDHLEKSEKIDYLAYHDELTGLANRNLFLERVNQYANQPGSEQRKLAVAIADVERFQAINDTLGRPAGDQLLKQIAERLVQHSEESKWLSRISADQFVIVVPDVQAEEEVVRRIEQRLQACFGRPYLIGDTELRVSAKFGVGMFPADGTDAESLFKNADAALKKAKTTGEKYLFYTQQMNERSADKLTLENKLRQALEKDEFVLYYQPKVNLETWRIESVEALIRWNSPELGLVPPIRFIPLMEETGIILEVGAWALRKATHDHCQWLQQGLPAPRIAVNVSAIQLHKRDFVRTVQLALERGATPPGIDLEITESVVMGDIESNIDKLMAIRDMGLSISIDDFGTGYSSLAYLTKLPVQTLKIDRSFVIKMLDEPDTMTLVSSIISLAHSLRLKVVAEGVETEQQAQALRTLRCDQMQGYLFSRPLPMEQLAVLLKK